MFIKSKIIYLFLIMVLSESIAYDSLEVTNDGIYSNEQEKLISNKIHSNESMSYDFYFSDIKNIGRVLIFESNAQYKKTCYFPIIKLKKKYYTRNMFCFNFDINVNSAGWSSSSYLAKEVVGIDKISIDTVQENDTSKVFFLTANSQPILDKEKKKISFDTLMYQSDRTKYMISNSFMIAPDVPPPYYVAIDNRNLCVRFVVQKKSFLYNEPNTKKTKMYLIKGDKVTILDEQADDSGQKWYFINYKGKKDLKMWIKAEAVDITDGD